MNPPASMKVTGISFQSAIGDTASYNLPEIWPLPINGSGRVGAADGLELRRGPFGSTNLGQLVEAANLNREVCGNGYLVLEQAGGCCGGTARKRREVEDEAANGVSGGGGNYVHEGGKRLKSSGPNDENQNSKVDAELGTGKETMQNTKSPPDPSKDYIHVRARRGQATDSHSLAERARREKISERMRILQEIVPGCNKVIGKALVLDEIINYIQSLQRQVEFLSMKLEAVNARMNFGMEGYTPEDHLFGTHAYDPSGVAYSSQPPREYSRGSSPADWLHMQVGGGCFQRQT